MKKRNVMLTVALSAACLAGSGKAGDQKLTVSDKGPKIEKNISKNGSGAGSTQKPVWPDDAKVRCYGCNSCQGKGSCKSANNSCAGKNGCKGKGWIEVTAKECRNRNGTILGESNSK